MQDRRGGVGGCASSKVMRQAEDSGGWNGL